MVPEDITDEDLAILHVIVDGMAQDIQDTVELIEAVPIMEGDTTDEL